MKQITEAQFLEKAQRYTDRKLSELRFECFWIVLTGILATAGLYISVCHYWEYCTQLDGLYLLGWLFILLSLLVLVASLFVKKLNIGLIKLLTGFNLIVGGIFCFLAVPFSKVGQGFESLFAAFGADPKSGLVLSAGAIVAGILSFLAGVIVIAEPYLKKLFK